MWLAGGECGCKEVPYIAGNIGGELNLADWRFASRPPN